MRARKIISVLILITLSAQSFFIQTSVSSAKEPTKIINLENKNSREIKEKRNTLINSIKYNNDLSNIEVSWDNKKALNPKLINKINKKSSGNKEKDAQDLVSKMNNIFKIKDIKNDIKKEKEFKDKKTGTKHTRLKQNYKGIPVYGGEMIMHEDSNGEIKSLTTNLLGNINITTTPKLSKQEALNIGLNKLKNKGKLNITKNPQLVIYPVGNNYLLTYQYVLSYETKTEVGKWIFLIDANKGKIINSYNNIKNNSYTFSGAASNVSGNILLEEGGISKSFTGWREGTISNPLYYILYDNTLKYIILNDSIDSLKYIDYNNFAFRNSSNWLNTDSTEISAAYNIGLTLNYFKDLFNFGVGDIFGDTGTVMVNSGVVLPVSIHNSSDINNAYWTGDGISLGDGDGEFFGDFASLEIVGHEFAHGWTDATSNLIYQNEQGALNESFSDIMGTNIELTYQTNNTASYPNYSSGTADWLIGEDVAKNGPFRNMRNPNGIGYPSRYKGTNWYFGAGDNGGVHYNSSVQNFFYYLLVNGGSGNNDGINYDVSGIGLSNAANLAYNVNSNYLITTSNFLDARLAWIQAANDIDNTGNMANSVIQAWNAVGVYDIDLPDQYNELINYKFEPDTVIPADFEMTGSGIWNIDNLTGAISPGSIISSIHLDDESQDIVLSGVTGTGYIGFWLKTSTEGSFDKLKFYIDGNLHDNWSGETPWTFYKTYLSGGNHTFIWSYQKDFSDSTGLDTVWIDDIILPPAPFGSLNIINNDLTLKTGENYYSSGGQISTQVNVNKKFINYDISGGDVNGIFTGSLGENLTGTKDLYIINSGDGEKMIPVVFTDQFGNTYNTGANVFLDTTGPLSPIIEGINDGDLFTGALNINWIPGADEGVGTSNGSYIYSLENTYNYEILSGTTSNTGVIIPGVNSDGEYNLNITGFDSLGNIGESANKKIIIDTRIPTLTGTFLSGTYTNNLTNNLKLISSEPITYILTGSSLENEISGNSSGEIILPVTLTGSEDGLKNITINYTDNAGNTGSTDVSINLDLSAPEYILNIYNGLSATGSLFTLTGSTTDIMSGVGTVIVNGASVGGDLSNWTTSINLYGGENNININFSDILGNTTNTGVLIYRNSVSSDFGVQVLNTSSVLISFKTDINSTGGIIFGTSESDLNNYIEGNINGINHSINLTNLNLDTEYFYQVFGKDINGTGQLSEVMSFKMPQIISDFNQETVLTGAIVFSGSTGSGINFGSNSGVITLLNNDGLNSVILNLNGLNILNNENNWDGLIQAPEIFNTGVVINDSGYSKVGNVYQIGNLNSSLILSGQLANVSINLGTNFNGKNLKIYRSSDSVNFSNIGTCLVLNGICNFNTDHFSLFTFGEPTDITPNPFSFNPATYSELSTETISQSITITGLNKESPISINNGSYSINNGVFTNQAGIINNNDSVRIKAISSSSYSANTTATLTIGGVSGNFVVTTKSQPVSLGGSDGGGGGSSSSPNSNTAPVNSNLVSTGTTNNINIVSPILNGNKKVAYITKFDANTTKNINIITDKIQNFLKYKSVKSGQGEKRLYISMINALKKKIGAYDSIFKKSIINAVIKNLEKKKNLLKYDGTLVTKK